MYVQNKFYLFIIFFICVITAEDNAKKNREALWSNELNYLAYQVIKASSVNIIRGINLSLEQLEALHSLALEIASNVPPVLPSEQNVFNQAAEIKETYARLLTLLERDEKISPELTQKLLDIRRIETEIIKESLVADEIGGTKSMGCIACHALPDASIKGNADDYETRAVTKAQRARIDNAHIEGLFGKEGVLLLWKLKSKVDTILFGGQKYILKDFRCCLLPADDLADSANVGQAFVSDEWMHYFQEVREFPIEHWKDYRQLFLYPIEDFLRITLPGIRKKDRKAILKEAGAVIERARGMDDIDFELQKKKLCIDLKNAMNVDFLIGEDSRTKEQRQFIAAMYLLLPGVIPVYTQLIKKIKSGK